jgi:hypothetical protein
MSVQARARLSGFWIVLNPLQSSKPTALGRALCVAAGAALAVPPDRTCEATSTPTTPALAAAADQARQ